MFYFSLPPAPSALLPTPFSFSFGFTVPSPQAAGGVPIYACVNRNRWNGVADTGAIYDRNPIVSIYLAWQTSYGNNGANNDGTGTMAGPLLSGLNGKNHELPVKYKRNPPILFI